MIDPEHARQHRAEGQDGPRQARGVDVGDHHVVPVPQPQVGQLAGEPEHGGPRHEQGEGPGAEAGDQRAAFGPGDELVEGEEEAGPGEEEEVGGHRLHAEGGEPVEARHPGHAKDRRSRQLKVHASIQRHFAISGAIAAASSVPPSRALQTRSSKEGTLITGAPLSL